MIDPERIQRLAAKMGNRKDALEFVRQMRCGGKMYGDGGPEKKRLFDKKKIADRVPADGGYPGGTSGVIDAVRHYLSNDDSYVGDRIRGAMAEASRGALDPESLSQMLAHEDAKRIYLGMPQEYGSFEPSPYRPTIGSMDNPYQLNGLLSDSSFENTILPMYATWKTGKDWPLYDTESRVMNLGKTAQLSDFPYLHRAGMSEGFDDNGQYISLQDTWDYNTAVKGKSGDNVGKWIGGKPFDIYQRYYLDDWLDIPDDAKGNPYIAPSYIEADYTGSRYVPDYTFWGLPQERGEWNSTNEFGCGGKKYPGGGKFFRTNLQNESPLMYNPIIPSVPDVPIPVRYEPEPNLGLYEYPSTTGMAKSYPVNLPSRVPVSVQESASVPVVVEDEPIVGLFSDEAKARRRLKQRYAESKFNDSAVSDAGAMGAWQIMPITLKDYLGRGRGKQGDINNAEYNGRIRDWVMSIIPRDLQEFWSEDDSDINKLAKLYAAYNWGAGSLRNYLRKRQKAGKSIDDPYEWVEGLNPETKRYVKYLAFDEDFDEKTGYTTKQFEDAARAKGYMAEGGRLLEMGGPEKTWQEAPLSYTSETQLFRPLQSLRDPMANDKFVFTFGNWLNNRRDVLAKNMKESGMDSGERRYFALPFYNTIGLSPEEKAVNGELESQLARVEGAGYTEKLLPLFTHGQYNPKKNEVELSTVLGKEGNPKDVVALHEYGHALGHGSPQEEVIRRYFTGKKGKDKYLDDPSEIYTRLMTFRKLHNIDPNKTYTLDDVKKLRGEAQKDFDDVITKPWTEHDKLQKEYSKKLADYLYPKLKSKLKDAWWWKGNGGDAGFYKSLLNDFMYARGLADDYEIEIPSDIQNIFDNSQKAIHHGNSIQDVRYSEDNDFFRRMSDEDMLFLLNEVANVGEQESLYGNHLGNLSASGGKIHIKPENRGKFTALLKRTGKSASWFKEHGTPLQRKRATFALNARKWKHGDGGPLDKYGDDAVRAALKKMRELNIYDGNEEDNRQMLREKRDKTSVVTPSAGILLENPLDWNAKSWLELRAENDRGPKYTDEDVRTFESHVPEYRDIETRSKMDGTWLLMPDGSRWSGDPREWVIMQSNAYKSNYAPTPWWTGQARYSTGIDGQNRVNRARYHDGTMWFSNNEDYARSFAALMDSLGEKGRRDTTRGEIFLAGIPKNVEIVDSPFPSTGTGDDWRDLPLRVNSSGEVLRIPADSIVTKKHDWNTSETGTWMKNLRVNETVRPDSLRQKTDSIANKVRATGANGLYLHQVYDGPLMQQGSIYDPLGGYFREGTTYYRPIEELITFPPLTPKIKFIRGNNGDFDPSKEDKYSYLGTAGFVPGLS